MAWTQQNLNDLDQAIASGARSVSYEGKQISYGSLDEMLRIRGMIMTALGMAMPASRTIFAGHDRGYPGGLSSSADDSELYTGY